MQLISLELGKDQFFWSLDNVITLTSESNKSPLFDIEQLSDEARKTIENSIKFLIIKAFTSDGNRIKSIEHANFVDGELAVSIDDIEEDTFKYEVKEITVKDDDDEEEEEEILQPSNADIAEATKLLKKNGNTVKKYLSSLEVTKDKIPFLHACLSIENSSKKPRYSIIEILEEFING